MSSPITAADAPTASASRGDDPARRRRPPRDRGAVLPVATVGLVVAVARWWFAADRRVFHVVADEPGQLAMARWLAGGTRWNMFDHNTWRPGYSLVLAPVYWIADSGEAVVRGALTVNAALAGVSAIILTRLLARWTTDWRTETGGPALGPWTCAGIAGTVALAPAAISASAYTWAEALVTCTFLATVWWVQRFVDSGRLGHALVATMAAAVAMTTHGRSLALLPIVIAIGSGVFATRRRWAAAAAVVGYGAALAVASTAFTRWVHDAVWDDPSDVNGADSVIERLDAPAALADSFAGQAWYQLVASFGLVGIGAAVVLGSFRARSDRLDRRSAAALLALITPLALTSVAFMADRTRADQLIYGRYVDAIVWPLAAIGLAAVVRHLVGDHPTARRRLLPILLTTAAICAVLGLVVAWQHGDQLDDDVGLRMMVPGLLPHIGGTDGVPVVRITTVVVVAILAVALALVHPRSIRTPGAVALAAVIVAGALGWSAVRVHDAHDRILNVYAIGDAVARIEAIVPDGEPIGVVMVPDAERPRVAYSAQRHRYQVYQLYLDDHEFVWERTPRRISARFVFAPARTAALLDAGATARWIDPKVAMALWELPDRTDRAATRLPSPP